MTSPSPAVLAMLTSADPETGVLTLGTWPTLRSAELAGWITRLDPTDHTDRPDRFTVTEAGRAVEVPDHLRVQTMRALVHARFPRNSWVAGPQRTQEGTRHHYGTVDSYADTNRDRFLRVRTETDLVLLHPSESVRVSALSETSREQLLYLAEGPRTTLGRSGACLVRKALVRTKGTRAELTRAGRLVAAALADQDRLHQTT